LPFPSTQTKDCRKVRHLKGPDKWAKIEKHIFLFVDYHTWIGVAVPWPVMADVLLASLVGNDGESVYVASQMSMPSESIAWEQEFVESQTVC
jgi:hypothetical protein